MDVNEPKSPEIENSKKPSDTPVFLFREAETSERDNCGFVAGMHLYHTVTTILSAAGFSTGKLSDSGTQNLGRKIGILWHCPTNQGGTFIWDAMALAKAGCVGFLIVAEGGEDCCPFRRSPLLCAYGDSVEGCAPNAEMLIAKATLLKNNAARWQDVSVGYRQTALKEVAAYYAVFHSVNAHLGHGSSRDIANTLLAPMRLLAKFGDKTKANTKWKEKNSDLDDLLKNIDGDETKEPRYKDYKEVYERRNVLQNSIMELKGVLDKSGEEDPEIVAGVAKGLMMLLTEFRNKAGLTSGEALLKSVFHPEEGEGFSAQSPESNDAAATKPDPFRLLVVDDHYDDWAPVFECLKERISQELEIVVSKDGKKTNKGEFLVAAALRCDAVLLDIMINGVNGIHDVLPKIREYSANLPVVLWTTTRTQEITNQAELANGVLLKKTVDDKEFTGTLRHWLEVGQRRRKTALLNPFFDGVIKKPEYRAFALDITEWALKWMSGFHATGEYFRAYTDHGGRHFTRVLRFLEQALHPLLGGEEIKRGSENTEAVLSNTSNEREDEFLALYLAVFLHEIGMFPLTKMDMRALDDAKYMTTVRGLHAPRGMLMLAENSGKEYWRDERGETAYNALFVSLPESVRLKTAIFVGYHARFFQSLSQGKFLEWDNLKSGVDKILENADKFGMFNGKARELLQGSLCCLKTAFSDEAVSTRLARLAALLRVCDAVDKDRSRIPPAYLCCSGLFNMNKIDDAAPEHNRELLKSLVCAKVEVEDGEVTMTVNAKAPTMDEVKIATGTGFAGTDDEINNLWGNPNPGAVKVWEKALENHIEAKWEKIISQGGKVEDDELKSLVSLSALACGAEVIDEYNAIMEVFPKDKEGGKVKLASFVWDSDKHASAVEELKYLIGDAK